jgi:hypothetical protein
MNHLILISPDRGSGFKPILSGQKEKIALSSIPNCASGIGPVNY